MAEELTNGFWPNMSQKWDRFKDWASRRNAPQIGNNPYKNQWDTLISQLQRNSRGDGPSLAGSPLPPPRRQQ